MQTPTIEPGTYLPGFPTAAGGLLYLYRCPLCWFDWLGIPHRQDDTAYGYPAEIKCPRCEQFGKYTNANSDAYTSAKIRPETSKIRGRRAKPDTTLPGGLFD